MPLSSTRSSTSAPVKREGEVISIITEGVCKGLPLGGAPQWILRGEVRSSATTRPFLHLTVWAIILAVALYPFHQALAGRLGGRQGLSSTLIVLLGAVLIIVATGLALGDDVRPGAELSLDGQPRLAVVSEP
jgi:hypothetical protein